MKPTNNNTSNNNKRNVRIEKKKKRMAALLEVSKLNASDRTKVARNSTLSDTEQPSAKRLRTAEGEDGAKQREEIVDEAGEPVGQELLLNVSINGLPAGATLDDTVDYIEGKMSGGGKQANRKKVAKQSARVLPKFWLRDVGLNAALSTELDQRIPLFMSDIQHLIMYAQLGLHAMYKPTRWCQLEKHGSLNNTNVLILEGISMNDFVQFEKFAFPYLSSTFRFKFEIIAPQAYNGDCVKELSMVPLSNTQSKKYLRLYGSMRTAEQECNEVFNLVRNVFPVDGATISGVSDGTVDSSEANGLAANNNVTLPSTDAFPRTHLLMSGWQMVEENYPLPIRGLMDRKYKGYVLTKDRYNPVTTHSPMFGLDCEMCLTTSKINELTRISVVNEKYEVVYERLVKPDHMITDYLTQYSGITQKMLQHVTLRLEEVQKDLRKLLPADCILVGQSLGSDLHALKMMHPYVIDTSIIYNLTGDRQRKSKLKLLAAEFLRMGIQEGSKGHCSAEDSIASLRLAQHKLTKSLNYGDAVMNGLANAAGPSKQTQCKSAHPELVGNATFATSMLKQVTKLPSKRVQIMASSEFLDRYKYYTYKMKAGVNTKTVHNIKFTEINNNINSAVHNITKSATNYSLNITHIRLKDSNSIGQDNTVQYYGDLDTAIKRMAEASADPSLQMVVFTGSLGGVGAGHEAAGNGCCFVNVKWPSTPDAGSPKSPSVANGAASP